MEFLQIQGSALPGSVSYNSELQKLLEVTSDVHAPQILGNFQELFFFFSKPDFIFPDTPGLWEIKPSMC